MSTLNNSRTLAVGRTSTQTAECARPRAQQAPIGREIWTSPALDRVRTLLRPGTGALRLFATALLLADPVENHVANKYRRLPFCAQRG